MTADATATEGLEWLPEAAEPPPPGRNARVGLAAAALLALGAVGVVACCVALVKPVRAIYPHMTERPDVSGPALSAARAAAARSLNQTLASVSLPGAVRVGEGTDEACFQGQHGLSNRDDFNHVCTTRRTVFYSVPAATLRDVMVQTGTHLAAAGWRAGRYPVSSVLTQDPAPANETPYSDWKALYTRGADSLALQFGSAERSELLSTAFSQQHTGSAALDRQTGNLYPGIRYWENSHELGGGALTASLSRARGTALVVLSAQRAWFRD